MTFLDSTTFAFLDLETTGGSTAYDRITEIGIRFWRDGQVVDEWQTLLNPRIPIPPFIERYTGISNAMVADAPVFEDIADEFEERLNGTVFVAHNARFDTGFLRRGYEQLGLAWPRPTVIDTVAVARTALLRDEVPNCKLATLARYFRATTEPNHRALSDARATVDVLHGLLARVGNLGVHTLEDLTEFALQVSPDRRAKRVWAQQAPECAGVYYFVADSQAADGAPKREVLYVGKSNNLKRRVRSYFSAAEKRGRIHEMVRVATGVEFIACATDLEAEVRELRMIESLAPRYNRKSRNQRKLTWLKLTDEAFPRLSIVHAVRDDAPHFGPFRSREAADNAALTLYDAFKLRRCTTRLSKRKASPACALAEMGRCLAPCELGPGAEGYAEITEAVRSSWEADARPVLRSVRGRLNKLIAQQRYEEAGVVAERLTAYYRTSLRYHRVRALARCRQLVAAAPSAAGWDIHVIRYGRLAAATTATSPRARAAAEEATASAETVLPPVGGWPAASIEEAERVAAWLELPGIRLIETDGDWEWPLHAGLPDDALPLELLGEQPLAELLAS